MTGKTIKKEWSLDLDFSAPMGEIYTRFMEGLKEKEFLGNRCGDGTYFPPRPFCDKTLEAAGEWLQSDGTGKVEAFTVIYEKSSSVAFPDTPYFPDVPYVLGVIRVNGSDQSLIHFLGGLDSDDPQEWPEKIQVGMKVRPVWSQERAGNILDIKYFEPC